MSLSTCSFFLNDSFISIMEPEDNILPIKISCLASNNIFWEDKTQSPGAYISLTEYVSWRLNHFFSRPT